MTDDQSVLIRWFAELGQSDGPQVGGKNASLGEMIATLGGEGIRVPDGFATTAAGYRELVAANDLDEVIRGRMAVLAKGEESLEQVGRAVRGAFAREGARR